MTVELADIGDDKAINRLDDQLAHTRPWLEDNREGAKVLQFKGDVPTPTGVKRRRGDVD